MYARECHIDLPQKQSAFLWGARQTGKSYYLKQHFKGSIYYDSEIPDFNLLNALQHGLIPNHYLAEKAYINDYLQAYIDIYLTDEIRNEGLVRNLAGFARFLDVAGLCNGAMVK